MPNSWNRNPMRVLGGDAAWRYIATNSGAMRQYPGRQTYNNRWVAGMPKKWIKQTNKRTENRHPKPHKNNNQDNKRTSNDDDDDDDDDDNDDDNDDDDYGDVMMRATTMTIMMTCFLLRYDPTTRPWYHAARTLPGKVTFSVPYLVRCGADAQTDGILHSKHWTVRKKVESGDSSCWLVTNEVGISCQSRYNNR